MRTVNLKLLSIYFAILATYPVSLFAQTTTNEENVELKIERVPLIQIKITGNENTPLAQDKVTKAAISDDEDVVASETSPTKKPVKKPATKANSNKPSKAKGRAVKNNTVRAATTSPTATPVQSNSMQTHTQNSSNLSEHTSTVTPQGTTTITNHTVNTVTYNITNNVITSDDSSEESSTSITMPVKPDGKTTIRPLKTPPNIVKHTEKAVPDATETNNTADKQPSTTVIVIPPPEEITPKVEPVIIPVQPQSQNTTNNAVIQSAQGNSAAGVASPVMVPTPDIAPAPAPVPTPAPAPETVATPAAEQAVPAAAPTNTPAAAAPVTEPTQAPAAEPAAAPSIPAEPAAPQTPPAPEAPATPPAAPVGEQMMPQSQNDNVKSIAYKHAGMFDKRFMRQAFALADNQAPRFIQVADNAPVIISESSDNNQSDATLVEVKPVETKSVTVIPEQATNTAVVNNETEQKKTVKKNTAESTKRVKSTPPPALKPYQPKVTQAIQPYGLWIKATKGSGKRPTIIALHGCGGLYTNYGNNPKLTPRHETMARVFTSMGFNVLFPDLFMPRGIYGNCTEPLTNWVKTSDNDRHAVESALEWLATQSDVDMNRIVFFGWSYGATVMLNSLNLAHTDVAVRNTQPKAAVAFYPYCEPYLDARKPYKLAAPTEVFVGENDTWTPAKACERFEDRLLNSETQVNVFTYPDTYHDFDAPGTPIYVRLDVNPADGKPGGITAGGNSISRAAAYKEILLFLKDKLQ